MGFAMAHNTEFTNGNIPVIIQDDLSFPFLDGERERDWHYASESEFRAYEAYWNAQEG